MIEIDKSHSKQNLVLFFHFVFIKVIFIFINTNDLLPYKSHNSDILFEFINPLVEHLYKVLITLHLSSRWSSGFIYLPFWLVEWSLPMKILEQTTNWVKDKDFSK